ncbi:prenylcysteine oxidase 1-like [Heptranchias perlo]|uniref:prenylcysteine oxidase 1-like n=1 Tax=Heptranchias perlo TaxID=212740 RepID=UPI003559FA6B
MVVSLVLKVKPQPHPATKLRPQLLKPLVFFSKYRYLCFPPTPRPPSAVIGAGIGGSSAAHFLRQQFGEGVKIDVYESKAVGGHFATANISGQEYEIGATTIHPLNLHTKEFVRMLGLKERKHPDNLLAVYDGEEFVFEESDWFIVNIIKLIWRYGFDILRMKMWVESYLHRFMKVYQYQTHGYSFTSLEKLLHEVGGDEFVQMTKHSIDEALQQIGISQRFMNEMVTPIMRLNYGQSVNINAFVGMTSLLAAESDLWTVDGGNKLICAGLLYSAKVNLIKGKVTSVNTKKRPLRNGEVITAYEVNYTAGPDTGYNMYDIVIVATPLHQGVSKITFQDLSQPIRTDCGQYQQKVVTLVEGRLNASYFGHRGPGRFRTTAIVTMEHSSTSILAANVLGPVTMAADYQIPPPTATCVWKVLSREPLAEQQLSRLFVSRSAMRETRWMAYPRYSPPEKVPPFLLHDRIYYLNAIEWAASTVEMIAVAAKNAALLSYHRWFQQLDRIDQDYLQQRLKVEL